MSRRYIIILGILVGICISFITYSWNLRQVNNLYLLQIQKNMENIDQYNKVQEALLEAIKTMAGVEVKNGNK